MNECVYGWVNVRQNCNALWIKAQCKCNPLTVCDDCCALSDFGVALVFCDFLQCKCQYADASNGLFFTLVCNVSVSGSRTRLCAGAPVYLIIKVRRGHHDLWLRTRLFLILIFILIFILPAQVRVSVKCVYATNFMNTHTHGVNGVDAASHNLLALLGSC